MTVTVVIAELLLAGLLLGVFVRFASPGPDPMPLWLTWLIGAGGVLCVGLLAWALAALGAPDLALAFGLLGMFVPIALYRRFAQRRGLSGPDAKRFPRRGIGVARRRRRLGLDVEGAERLSPKAERRLIRLARKRRRGKIGDAEFEAKRAELLREAQS